MISHKITYQEINCQLLSIVSQKGVTLHCYDNKLPQRQSKRKSCIALSSIVMLYFMLEKMSRNRVSYKKKIISIIYTLNLNSWQARALIIEVFSFHGCGLETSCQLLVNSNACPQNLTQSQSYPINKRIILLGVELKFKFMDYFSPTIQSNKNKKQI